MKTEDVQLLILKGAISNLPADQQQKVNECAEKLSATVSEYGELGLIALSLVGATEAAK
jgi:hypothetical protein